MDKLKAIGVSGRLLRVLSSYLSNRKQYVDIDGHKSSLLDIFSGIPQGSILGPLLFLVYVIDLTVNVRSSTYAFADDAKLLSIHRRNSHCELQGDLNVLNSWAANNSLQFSLDKCHILPFRPTDSNFVLNSATLENVSNEKDLGVVVSSDLSWTPHIRKQCQKTVSVFFLIRRNISSSVSVAARLNLYKSMIVTVLTYNSPVWFANRSNQKSLESVQRRVTHWILLYQTESYFERMKTLNISIFRVRFFRVKQLGN